LDQIVLIQIFTKFDKTNMQPHSRLFCQHKKELKFLKEVFRPGKKFADLRLAE
jgi:hypothetical protein